MEWTYEITQPFSIGRSADDGPDGLTRWGVDALLAFSPGEIDETLYCSLKVTHPAHVARRPTNPLVAAVYAVRGHE